MFFTLFYTFLHLFCIYDNFLFFFSSFLTCNVIFKNFRNIMQHITFTNWVDKFVE